MAGSGKTVRNKSIKLLNNIKLNNVEIKGKYFSLESV